MEQDEGAFYIVRKGDIVGIYKSLSDCQAQVGSSVCDPSVSVFKGYGLSKDAKEYLDARGLKNAAYSIHVADVKTDLLGKLFPCPFQQPAFSGGITVDKNPPPKISQGVLGTVQPAFSGGKAVDKNPPLKISQGVLGSVSCILEFDGASKGNPGPAGAGAVLRSEDGRIIRLLREGLGTATNNVAEYRAMILGLKYALRKGFKHIRVQGDSNLVVMQIKGLWKIKSQNMADLCKEAKELKDKFLSFEIEHVLRESNSEADVQANLAVNLKNGQVEEE